MMLGKLLQKALFIVLSSIFFTFSPFCCSHSLHTYNFVNSVLCIKLSDTAFMLNSEGFIIKIRKNKRVFVNFYIMNVNCITFIVHKTYIFCFHSNGTTLWANKLPNFCRGVISIYKSKILAKSVNNSIYLLDINNGKVLWFFNFASNVSYTTMLHKSLFYGNNIIVNISCGFYILNIDNGQIVWKYFYNIEDITITNSIYNKILLINHEIVFCDDYGNIYNFNLRKMKFKWIKTDDITNIFYINNRFIMVFSNGVFSLINISNGDVFLGNKLFIKLQCNVFTYKIINHNKIAFLLKSYLLYTIDFLRYI